MQILFMVYLKDDASVAVERVRFVEFYFVLDIYV